MCVYFFSTILKARVKNQMCVLNDSEFDREIGIAPATMPMDYTSYLLSASPPGFDVQYRNYVRFGDKHDLANMGRREKNGFCHIKPVTATCLPKNCDTFNENETTRTIETLKALSLKANTLSTSSKPKKNVSFADENGLALWTIREFTESPNSPPLLRRGLLSAITSGASAGVTERPPLVLKFTQPASDYYQFREKLERLSVSLENVILKDYVLLGTVKVKNIAFEKKVKVRFTCDSWDTFTDVTANYVSNRHANANSPYDTFAFEINVPPTFDPKKSVQFVVCYEVGDKQFWDNNNEVNYVVTSTDWNSVAPEEPEDQNDLPVFSLRDSNNKKNWAEFTSWSSSVNDSTIPYW